MSPFRLSGHRLGRPTSVAARASTLQCRPQPAGAGTPFDDVSLYALYDTKADDYITGDDPGRLWLDQGA
jgi:hypothetical protein